MPAAGPPGPVEPGGPDLNEGGPDADDDGAEREQNAGDRASPSDTDPAKDRSALPVGALAALVMVVAGCLWVVRAKRRSGPG